MIKVSVAHLLPGMIVGRTIFGADGCVLLSEGVVLTRKYIVRLASLGIAAVYIQSAAVVDIEVPDVLCEKTRVQSLTAVRDILQKVHLAQELEVEKVHGVAKQLVQELMQNRQALVHLNDIRTHDDYTFAHCMNVCILSIVVGMELGYSEHKLNELAMGCLLHDVGKMLVAPETLNKQEPLTETERAVLKLHPEHGFELLRRQENMPLLAAHVAYQHHEKYDGTGYPRQLKGDEIHEMAKIAAVADVYDALTSDRAYRKALLPHEVYEMQMAASQTHFDPVVLDAFFRCIAIYPIGTVVQINTGEYGVVVKVLPGLQSRPVLRLLADAHKKPLRDKPEIDLTKQLTRFICKVLREEEFLSLL